jgi:hypothetical protein
MSKQHTSREVQALWRKVAKDSDTIAKLIGEIPAATVSGEDDWFALSESHDLLDETIRLLKACARRYERIDVARIGKLQSKPIGKVVAAPIGKLGPR